MNRKNDIPQCCCESPNNKTFSCQVHWHDKNMFDETSTHPRRGEFLSDNRLRTIEHNFGYSSTRPDMYYNVTETEGIVMAWELLTLRSKIALLRQNLAEIEVSMRNRDDVC